MGQAQMDFHQNTEYGVDLQTETGAFGAITGSLAVACPRRLTASMALTPDLRRGDC
ncbi:MAG TPA: hypothetical protein VF918_16455 [Anaerolineales bacterium]